MRIPDQQLIICRHAQILLQPQPGALGERVDPFEIPDPADRISLLQPLIKTGIAGGGKFAFISERAIYQQQCLRIHVIRDFSEEVFNGIFRHDVQRVRGENGIEPATCPRPVVDVESDWFGKILQRGMHNSAGKAVEITDHIRGVPGQIGQ